MVISNLHYYTNMYLDFLQLKMREARFWPKMKFEPIFFQVLWQFFNSKGSLLRQGRTGAGGRKEGLGGMPPALQILGEISSNFFERTPPVGKCLCWLALSHFALRATRDKCEGSPADFKRKLEFFIFAPLLRGWPKAGFPHF